MGESWGESVQHTLVMVMYYENALTHKKYIHIIIHSVYFISATSPLGRDQKRAPVDVVATSENVQTTPKNNTSIPPFQQLCSHLLSADQKRAPVEVVASSGNVWTTTQKTISISPFQYSISHL